jgi:DNA-binding transcriptional MerR regulator
MKYFTTLEVANELKVSKQTLLNWLYAGKVPEPPRNRSGYRLWSPSRVSLVKRLISDGRLHRRTIVHRDASNDPEVVTEYAREVAQFLKDARIALRPFVRELSRVRLGSKRRPARSRR